MLVLFLFFSIFCYAQLVPSGFYLTLRSDFINQVGNEISLEIADQANSYTTAPPINGNSGDITYSLSQWVFDIDLKGFSASMSNSQINLNWNTFMWIVQFNYHICDTGGPINICESGWIQIFTLNNLATTLDIAVNVNLEGPLVQASASSVTLGEFSTNCEVFVQCTDTFCLIDPSDIANAVAGGFQTAFESGVQTAMNNVLNQRVNVLKTSFELASLNIEVLMGSSLFSVNNNFVFSAKGVVDQGGVTPPFSASFVPPISAFSSPKSQITLTATSFFTNTGIWALNRAGLFDYVVTNKNLPPGSEYKLNTDDFFLKLLCPAFSQYPGLNVSITTSVPSLVQTSVGPSGFSASLNVQTLFTIYNSTFTKPAWFYNIATNPIFSYNPMTDGNEITFNFSATNWSTTLTVVKSWMGTIHTAGANYIIEGLLEGIAYPLETLNVPAGLTIGQLQTQFYPGFNSLSFDASYKSPPFLQCPDNSQCALDNTCCKWGNSYGCCTMPNAECCSSGCCMNGCQCDGNDCAC